MPYKFRKTKRTTKLKKKAQPYGPSLGKKPKMTRSLRVHQNLTRDVRWFKTATTIGGNNVGDFNVEYTPVNVWQCLDFNNWGRCWEEFKVLKVIVNFLPASVGSESLITTDPVVPPPPVTITPSYKRGNVIVYYDQGEQDSPSSSFLQLITKPSAKLVNPRRMTKRWMDRPSGSPAWGTFDPADGSIQTPDSWSDSRIIIQGQGFTPTVPPAPRIVWYFVTVAYKVIFRGRQKVVP